METNQHMHSVLARAIVDLHYIPRLDDAQCAPFKSWKKTSYGIFSADSYKILAFSAFIAKVQHNFMWSDFRISFSRLHQYSLEILVFIEYLPVYQSNKRSKKLNNTEKITNFIEFLKGYLLSRQGKKYKVLYYTILHEELMWKLKNSTLNSKTKRRSAKVLSPQLIVKTNGVFYIHRSPIVPEDIIVAAQANEPPVVARHKQIYAYWKGSQNKEIMVLGITKEVEYVLNCINNTNSIEQIISKVKHYTSVSTALDILEFLSQHQIIY